MRADKKRGRGAPITEVARRHRCRNRRDRDYGLFHKLGHDGLECGVTLRRPVAVSVGMDRNFDKIKASRLR
jgi:hypothetical protein